MPGLPDVSPTLALMSNMGPGAQVCIIRDDCWCCAVGTCKCHKPHWACLDATPRHHSTTCAFTATPWVCGPTCRNKPRLRQGKHGMLTCSLLTPCVQGESGHGSTPSLLDARAASPSAVYSLYSATPFRGALEALPIAEALNAPLVDNSPFNLTVRTNSLLISHSKGQQSLFFDVHARPTRSRLCLVSGWPTLRVHFC